MKKIILLVLLCQFIVAQKSIKPTEILVIGTYHFNNPGMDVAQFKVLDIMGEKPQKQLDEISTAIALYKPTKIFTEWELKDQLTLDTLYNKYLEGTYFDYVAKKYPKRKFYTKNEIVQLAFRAAKKSNHKKVFAIDYQETSFDYDSVIDKQRQSVYKKRDSILTILEDQINHQENKTTEISDTKVLDSIIDFIEPTVKKFLENQQVL